MVYYCRHNGVCTKTMLCVWRFVEEVGCLLLRMGVRRTGSSCEGKKPPHTRWSFQQVVRPSGNAPHPLYRPKPIRAPKKKSAKGSPQCSQAMDATSTTPGGTVRPMPGRAGRSSPCILAGLNLEHFAFGEGLGAELAPGGPHPDVLNHAWRDYGNRVGACWRLLDLFDEIHCPRRCC